MVHRWQQQGGGAYWLKGDGVLRHAGKRFAGDSILLLVDGEPGRVRTRLVIDGVRSASGGRRDKPVTATVLTTTEPQIQAPRYRGAPDQLPSLMKLLPGSGDDASSGVRPVQFQQPGSEPLPNPPLSGIGPSPEAGEIVPGEVPVPGTAAPGLPAEPTVTLPDGATTGGIQFLVGGGSRAVEIRARGAASPPQIETINRPETGESVIIARGGVTVLIRDVTAQLPSGEEMALGTVSLSADRIVGWLPMLSGLLSGATDFSQADGELYLEGDIVFRQGERIIYADSMYYNIGREKGIVLDAEAITTIPEYQGIVRLKAEVLQQISSGNFVAFDAAMTSSRLGVPRYWLQSEQLRLTERQRTVTDPVTGLPTVDDVPFASSTNNFVYLGGVPILYWPFFGTRLERPTFYLTSADLKNDDIFGTQLLLEWDIFQLLGWENAPPGVDATLSTDYLSDRGPAIGTNTEYNLPGLLGVPGPVVGTYDSWFIDDDGLDTLGRGRRNLEPEESLRGRSELRHRHYLPNDYEFIAELGYLSDRNFLEQYFENEWDQQKDPNTGLLLRKYAGNQLLDAQLDVQLNEFFMETERLPAVEHYALGSSWLGDRLTWSAHNRVGYWRLNAAEPPEDPAQAAKFSRLPGEFNRAGAQAATQQELSMPIQAGPVNVAPFIGGEAAYYGEAVDGESLARLIGQTGVRASLPMWRVDPTIQSSLLNVRGLAHKVEWTAEYFYADSQTNLEELPLYDQLDDNAQQEFRRRFIFDTFGGTLPDRFDPRTFALRQGLQRFVTSPSDTIADDLQQVRLGLHQRFQTKRGLPGRSRIVDLFQFDVDTILFPREDRHNFGETLGPTTYDMRYHLGDRVTLLSDGYFDWFDDGLRSVSAGVRSSRPGLGDLYLGLLSLEGPISSTVLRSKLDYRLNQKWILSAGTTYDFGETGNVGQSLGLTRIGESFLVQLGMNVDAGRDNVSLGFSVEPRFWPSAKLGRVGGELIPPPGVEGLE